MARLSTCKLCNKQITKEEKYTYANKTYCIDCYNIKLQEKQDYDTLIGNICRYFDEDKPNGLILKQVKDYKENFDFCYSGMTYCLWYITEILNKKIDKKYGIALVKFEYENAKNYFTQQQNIKNSITKPTNVEVVKKVKLKSHNNFRDKLLINIDDLISEGE